MLSKVIIEAALLTDEEKISACALSKAAGADYVKTSTGFGPGGATVADVELMRRVVGPDIGVKAAGGVRDYEALKSLVSAGASRVGASAGVKIVQQSKGGAQPSVRRPSAAPPKSSTGLDRVVSALPVLAGLVFPRAFFFHLLVVDCIADFALHGALETLTGSRDFFAYRPGRMTVLAGIIRAIVFIHVDNASFGYGIQEQVTNGQTPIRAN